MNILMMTNTYKPVLGGLERSVSTFSRELRERGHDVLIVAPEFRDAPSEKGVVRVPAIQRFNGTDFSVELPVPGILSEKLKKFSPEIVHSHHPFLIGDTALRIAASRRLPLVFTFHTLYEEYTHYVPGDSPAIKKFVTSLSVGYANLCNRVLAPSESIHKMLQKRGVTVPVDVLPTGIYPEKFQGDGNAFRRNHGVGLDSFVVGFVGRLAIEKNLRFLSRAMVKFLKVNENAILLMIGNGPLREELADFFGQHGLAERVVFTGVLEREELADAYAAMDVFVFASKSETQGLVLIEAMAAGTPVIALDAPGAREVVEDGINGRLLFGDNEDELVRALTDYYNLSPVSKRELGIMAGKIAQKFSVGNSIEKLTDIYRSLSGESFRHNTEQSAWSETIQLIRAEWALFLNMTKATGAAVLQLSRKPGRKGKSVVWRRKTVSSSGPAVRKTGKA